jgi:hypothetical protein
MPPLRFRPNVARVAGSLPAQQFHSLLALPDLGVREGNNCDMAKARSIQPRAALGWVSTIKPGRG